MTTGSLGLLPSRISDLIRSLFSEGRRVFWPGQFVRAGLGSEELVVASMKELVGRHELVLIGDVVCENNHVVRRIRTMSLPIPEDDLHVECLECPVEQDRHHRSLRVWFELAPEYASAIGSQPPKKAVG